MRDKVILSNKLIIEETGKGEMLTAFLDGSSVRMGESGRTVIEEVK